MTEAVHDLIGAYALDALPSPEAETFEAHLTWCADCPAELDELAPTVAQLGSALAVAPPAGLRDRVLAEVETTPQAPPGRRLRPVPGEPDVDDADPAARGPGTPVPTRHARGRPSGDEAGRAGVTRWPTRLIAAAAAVCALLAGAFGLLADRAGQRADRAAEETSRLAASSEAVASLLTRADATVTAVGVRGGGRASVIASSSAGRLALVASGVADLPPSRTYQLWYVGDPQALQDISSVGVVEARDEQIVDVVERRFPPGTAFAMSIEPVGGSEQPTVDQIVLVAPIPEPSQA